MALELEHNPFTSSGGNLSGFALDASPVVPNDNADLFDRVVALGIDVTGGAGSVAIVTEAGQSRTVGMVAGGSLPVGVRRVLATGTTATGIVAYSTSLGPAYTSKPYPEAALTLTAVLPPDTALNETAFDADKNSDCVFACDFEGLDLSQPGYIWDAGGAGSGSYVGIRDDMLIVRAFDGGAPWDVGTAYLTSTMPSGDGTLVWSIELTLARVRAWWNGVELAQNGQRSATAPRPDYGGANESCYIGTQGGSIPSGETAASTAIATYTGASWLRYYKDQSV